MVDIVRCPAPPAGLSKDLLPYECTAAPCSFFFAHVTFAHIIIPHDNGRLHDDCADEKAVDA